MKLLRFLSPAHSRALLAFVLAALAMQGIVPAGLMVVPASGQGAQIILCPQTHPLARALAAQPDASADAEMAALHAAMGHGEMDHAAMERAAVDHSSAPDDPVPASSAAPAAQSCAFSGAGALAAMLSEHSEAPSAIAVAPEHAHTALVELRLADPPRLRPPLRAPPVLI
jgi:hypothetical protein